MLSRPSEIQSALLFYSDSDSKPWEQPIVSTAEIDRHLADYTIKIASDEQKRAHFQACWEVPNWPGKMTREEYIKFSEDNDKGDWAKDHGSITWVLVHRDDSEGEAYSFVVTLRRKCFIKRDLLSSVKIKEGWFYALIGSHHTSASGQRLRNSPLSALALLSRRPASGRLSQGSKHHAARANHTIPTRSLDHLSPSRSKGELQAGLVDSPNKPKPDRYNHERERKVATDIRRVAPGNPASPGALNYIDDKGRNDPGQDEQEKEDNRIEMGDTQMWNWV
ncbi:hypothetical protein IAT40_005119 [Kwoniella sp. CBS 6097]